MRIVVLQRGWVVAGLVRREGHHLVIRSAHVVRRWGTSKGLGELASQGPRQGTVLDPCPTIRCHELTVVLEIECDEAAWRGVLA